MNLPDVSYVPSGDVAIAYQIVGSSPVDNVFVQGITGDLLSTGEQPGSFATWTHEGFRDGLQQLALGTQPVHGYRDSAEDRDVAVAGA